MIHLEVNWARSICVSRADSDHTQKDENPVSTGFSSFGEDFMYLRRKAAHWGPSPRSVRSWPAIGARLSLAVFYLALAGVTSSSPSAAQSIQSNGPRTRIQINAPAGTSYTVQASDCGKLLSFANTTATAVTLPQPGAGSLQSGCWMDIQNSGLNTVILTPAGSLIDGSSSVSLTSNQGLRLVASSSGYFTQRGQGSGSGGGPGSLSIQSGGTSLGSSTTLNFVAGTGVACIPQVSSGVATLQCDADTSYLASKINLQGAGNPQICTSSSGGGSVYTAACASPLTAYAAGQTGYWLPDVTNTVANPTINFDTLGARTLLDQNGNALSIGQIKVTEYRWWNDGTNIRLADLSTSTSPSTPVQRAFGYAFDGAGSALTAGRTAYLTVPFACTVTAWSIALDAGTATLDVWRTSTGTSIPTAANRLTGTMPVLSTGTAIHSTNLTGWTSTSIAQNDLIGINLNAVSGATVVSFVVECDQ